MGWWGWVASCRRAKPAIKVYRVALSNQQVTDMYTTHRMGQDGHCQQFHTTKTLISAPQWPHRPCNASMWPYTVGKKPSVKVDLAIYSQAVDVRGQCMSESLKQGIIWISVLVTLWLVFINPVTYKYLGWIT